MSWIIVPNHNTNIFARYEHYDHGSGPWVPVIAWRVHEDSDEICDLTTSLPVVAGWQYLEGKGSDLGNVIVGEWVDAEQRVVPMNDLFTYLTEPVVAIRT